MKPTKYFYEKYLEDTVTDIQNREVISTWFWYYIDSKERTRVRLDKFLSEQLKNPDPELKKVSKEFKLLPYGEAIIEILRFVTKKVKYITDQRNFDKVEYWANASETWKLKQDDCDGINALIYILARLAGIPQYLIMNCIGDTKVGGHYWLLFFDTSHNGKWVPIDGTLYTDYTSVKDRPDFNNLRNIYTNPWFYFNEDVILKRR